MEGKPENIVLDNVHAVTIDSPDGEFILFAANNHVEFFLDEHGLQWAKFIAKNGPHVNREHCVPRERIISLVNKEQVYKRPKTFKSIEQA